jgi:SAM-dependent MidA family methyltransferase
MTPLQSKIIQRIQREGPLTFATFMETALYDTEYGYYGSGRAQIGSQGDFVTSVSVGPLFGTLLALQFAEMWEILDRPPDWSLVEQGAFDGQLAADVLAALHAHAPECFASTTVRLIEPFTALRERQVAKLASFRDRVAWHETTEDLPAFTGVHFSNELLDAFPVHRLRCTGSGWREMRVDSCSVGLEWVETDIEEAAVVQAASLLCPRALGAFAEVCPRHGSFFEEIAAKITRGWLLALDYGMSDAQLALPIRNQGTLSAYKKQQRQDNLLASPGEQDLTAHVNFSLVLKFAIQHGWTLEGFTEQQRFFSGLAPLYFKDNTAPPSPEQKRALSAFRTLTHPELMGFQFKALCVGKGLPKRGGAEQVSETPSQILEPRRLSGMQFARALEE